MKKLATVAGLFTVLAVAPAQAQDENDVAAYYGLNFTPIGSLTPMPATAPHSGWGFNLRANRIDLNDNGEEFRTVGGGLDFGMGRARLGVQGTITSIDCAGCDGLFGLGADMDFPLWTSATDVSMNSARFAIGVRPALGYGKGRDEMSDMSAVSFATGLPLSVTFGRKTSFVAYMTPGFGWGRVRNSATDLSESGTRPMLGGGIGIASLAGGSIGINLGFNRVFVDQGETSFGLGFSWHGPAMQTR